MHDDLARACRKGAHVYKSTREKGVVVCGTTLMDFAHTQNLPATYTRLHLFTMLSTGKASSNPAVRGNLVGSGRHHAARAPCLLLGLTGPG
jgi:hypothetical protein